jgi:hypothetical protein
MSMYEYLYVCIVYVLVCIDCILMYAVHIRVVCVCIACIGPDKHISGHNFANRPVPQPGTRSPYSGQPWSGAHQVYSAI